MINKMFKIQYELTGSLACREFKGLASTVYVHLNKNRTSHLKQFFIHCAVPYPPHGRSTEISRGRGVLKVKLLEAEYEANLAFPGGMGGAKQKPSVGEVWKFSGTLIEYKSTTATFP